MEPFVADMSNESGDSDRGDVFSEGFVVPITGLLALLFAVMAGGSAYPAFSGSWGLEAMALPVIFGAASLFFIRLRSNYVEKREAGE